MADTTSYKIQGRDAFSSTGQATGLNQLGNTLIYPPGATPAGAPNAITSGLPKEVVMVGLVLLAALILHKHAKV